MKNIKAYRNRKFTSRIKSKFGCKYCNETSPEALQFDHINPKNKFKNVSVLVSGNADLNIIKNEIRKCIILCNNCHAEKTFKNNDHFFNKPTLTNKKYLQRRKWKDKKQKFIDRLKIYLGCKQCGYNKNPRALQFDHIDRSTKIDTVTNLVKSVSLKKVKDEIRKCQLLCGNCHIKKTIKNKDHLQKG